VKIAIPGHVSRKL